MTKLIYLFLFISLWNTTSLLAQTPTATASSTNQAICNGGSFTITLSSNLVGTTYNWTRDNVATATGLAPAGAGDISGTLVNTTNAPVVVVFTITPENAGNIGAPITATVTVANESILYSATGQSLPYPGGTFSLNASGNGQVHWYDAPTLGNEVYVGNTFVTSLTSTTSFYVSNIINVGGGQVTTADQTGIFPGNTRGYVFQAPTNFVITSLYVPTTASSGPQSIAVVRFDNQTPPPIFSATTNAFQTLFVTQNNSSTGSISATIPVNKGDIIGILGSRGGVNSYGPANSTITIEGMPVNVTRLGMQFPLETFGPQNLWQEPGGNISRVFFDYALASCATPRSAVTATVEPCTPAAQVISANVMNVLGPNNCKVRLEAQAAGNAIVIQGPNEYVFSYVYRNGGTYNISHVDIAKPGTYTITAFSNLCNPGVDIKTFTVTGTACP